jgi:hypothetical protein
MMKIVSFFFVGTYSVNLVAESDAVAADTPKRLFRHQKEEYTSKVFSSYAPRTSLGAGHFPQEAR